MRYKPIGTAPVDSPEGLSKWITDELNRLSGTLANYEASTIVFEQQNVEPAKPFEGMVANADGSNWNPGSGVGLYIYRSAAWVKLG